MTASVDTNEFENLLDYLKRSRGFDFAAYKRTTLERRIEKRLQMLNIAKVGDYIDYLEVHPDEFGHLFNTILINVTGFFRDLPMWEFLQGEIIPKLLAGKAPGDVIRVWSAGCASGEEACTLAIILCEALGKEEYSKRVKIYATDVDDDELGKARAAGYSEKQVMDVPEHLRQKYFESVGQQYMFNRDLRRTVIFGRNNLVQDAPISRVDLLVCRNTLMYFNNEAQNRILARFHFALNEGGYLFLGKAEMLLTHQHLFLPVDLKRRVFTKVPKKRVSERLQLLAMAGNGNGGNGDPDAPGLALAVAADARLRELSFDLDVVAQVLIDGSGALAAINDQARGLFGLGAGEIGKPMSELEMSYRPLELRAWIEQARSERRAVVVRDVTWTPSTDASRGPQYFDVHVAPLLQHGSVEGVKVTFANVTRAKILADELTQSRHELETAYEELQTTNEELQSTNEEMETTNEELQSTNEEMETTNEEMQSTNEELQTLNNELTERSNELNRVNDFLESILASVDSGVMVLDEKFEVQTWNHRCEDLWGWRAEEVIGMNFFNLDIGLPVQELRQCIRGGEAGEGGSARKLTLEAVNRRGKKFMCNVTCTPLMRPDGSINGVIVVMDA